MTFVFVVDRAYGSILELWVLDAARCNQCKEFSRQDPTAKYKEASVRRHPLREFLSSSSDDRIQNNMTSSTGLLQKHKIPFTKPFKSKKQPSSSTTDIKSFRKNPGDRSINDERSSLRCLMFDERETDFARAHIMKPAKVYAEVCI